ncbi:MAG: aminotransferase class I/II-fold pyridoxal phosphate-dependent enzyme [Bacteroidetes Order II. Incertae sedis bacterium]|jgi:threonine aldolase|nr:aminotransferase class I/II-fold pyridoxal phosphate-dependent enzyme [Bacteroidetes Order II. bacterium]MBT4052728.1 aminotransferase class I/II-fold pyridoxal phosphate-dependent enzyme [Bacteroidetes Order II. bacterium]MBT4602441.1 aminotransferase class I/II-fold pyridoxal phosphate-dependent enzyme [Bacteroidetes Order II. bacterium]MBT5250541.1 aminotransferase class I/II-fold pyridoxal phosphate-dependent enzyme [Bacteroidetes Order II. bacterium]MBT6201218.1 aminotransferase class I
MKSIDLRSDTVTKPSKGMLAAMSAAEVGDDVFGEDPTVNRLQNEVADLLGKESAVFVPSGTMSNQIAVRIHTSPGEEAIAESGCHIRNYESGAAAALSGVSICSVDGKRGILAAEQVASHIRKGYEWEPRPRLVCLENTHNKAGGTVYPLETIQEIGHVARENHLAFHLDGARLWNATAATGISEKDYAAPFDTISVCLSKGLGTPIGSVLVGSSDHMLQARRIRKMLGGGMRQVGILAAAGLYALEHHRGELAQDHEKASVLASGLAAFSCVTLDPDDVETNIIMFDINDGRDALTIISELSNAGVRMVAFGPKTIRVTTHRDISSEDIDLALERASTVLN